MSVAYALRPKWTTVSGKTTISRPPAPATSAGGSAVYPIPHGDEFSEYELYDFVGWDGYDAEPITPETLRAARRFNLLLPRWPISDIAPGADGSIGFEWRTGPTSARVITFVEVGPGDILKAIRVSPDGSQTEAWPACSVYGNSATDLINSLFAPGNVY